MNATSPTAKAIPNEPFKLDLDCLAGAESGTYQPPCREAGTRTCSTLQYGDSGSDMVGFTAVSPHHASSKSRRYF